MITSFILPIGEHLLKIVEQLEIVTSSVNEAFVNMKNESAVSEITSEMEKFGIQKEREILGKCGIQLKKSIVMNCILLFL